MAKILIVEEKKSVARAIALLLDLHGFGSCHAGNADGALALLEQEPVALVIQELGGGPASSAGREGVALFRRIKAFDPELPVLLIIDHSSVETAARLVKEGAADYLPRPWDDARLVTSVRNLLRQRAVQEENRTIKAQRQRVRGELAERFNLQGLVYESEAMHEAVAVAVRIASSDVPVLISGAPGVGKERIAEVIQANSLRHEQPFLRIDTSGVPSYRLEAELFGAEAGAAPGVTGERCGCFESADGGTVFLNGVDTLSRANQMRLLRLLKTGNFERLGSTRTRHIDVRVISAASSDRRGLITSGKLREELAVRLSAVEITIPPLRDRPEDTLALALHFLQKLTVKRGAEPPALSNAARLCLVNHDWPGNVRELHNRIERACLVVHGNTVEPADLGLPAMTAPVKQQSAAAVGSKQELDEDSERNRIEEALIRCEGVVSKAAEELGCSRQELYRNMQRLGIVLERISL